MRATIDGTTVADSADDDLISIEGNWYFPPSSLVNEAFNDSPTPYTCPWKGAAQYHDISTPSGIHHDAGWSYPVLEPSAIERVGKDFAGYVAFDKAQVTIG